MVLILLVCLAFVFGLSLQQITYEAEEDGNITVRVDSPKETDLSNINMNCHFKSSPVKQWFEVVRGSEITTNQDEQFSGRVGFEQEALKQGRVQIHLTGLRPQDSGQYECHMAANYDLDRGEWEFSSTVYFEISVVLKHGSTLTTTKPGAHNDGAKLRAQNDADHLEDRRSMRTYETWAMIGLFFVGITVMFCVSSKKQLWINRGRGSIRLYP